MRTSVVIASHNEGDLLWRTVWSCVETTRELDCEIVVADDASTDGCVEEMQRRFPTSVRCDFPERRGVSPTKDLAARSSRRRSPGLPRRPLQTRAGSDLPPGQ